MHVAHLNWGILRADWDAPEVAEFVDALDRVNALAERSPGFVWRLGDEEMEAAQLDPDGVFGGNPRLASTLSVWESAAALEHFVHRTLHGRFLRRGGTWFEPHDARPAYVLWHIDEGSRPTMAEGVRRLRLLESRGPGPDAFDFRWAAAGNAA